MDTIEKLSDFYIVTSSEIKEGNENLRMLRDNENCKNLQDFLKSYTPFKKIDSTDSIRNIVTEVYGSRKVHVDTLATVGSNVLSNT